MNARLTLTSIAGLLLAFDGALAMAGQKPLPATQIQTKVERKLANEQALRGVAVTVQGTAVTLDGTVPSLWALENALDTAREVDGVDSVVSRLTITPAQVTASDVAERIRRHESYTVLDYVDVEASDGRVTLKGQVGRFDRAQAIRELVARQAGVQEVDNQIEVLPASIYDDQVRWEIAQRIYRTLSIYHAILLSPPIHITFRNGNVTLTGVVSSETQRRVAEQIALRTFGVFSVENKLRVEGSSAGS